MKSDFQIYPIPQQSVAKLLNANETVLIAHNAKWITVDQTPGYPCRVSLADARVGERVLLMKYKHHDVASPYAASGPIFVREGASELTLPVNSVPEMLLHRTLSLRGYNMSNNMILAKVVEGTELLETLLDLFACADLNYLHIHHAGPGCYSCAVHRV